MMEQQLKQRLVGVAVLAALVVIFLPAFLEAPNYGTEPDAPRVVVPPEPEFSSTVVPLDEVTAEELIAKATAPPAEFLADHAPAVSSVSVEAPPGETAGAEPQKGQGEDDDNAEAPRTGLSAWVIQLGSFSSRKNAKALVEKLRKDGYAAFVDQQSDNDEDVFRVKVGPEITRDKAIAIRDILEKKMKTKGFIERYRGS